MKNIIGKGIKAGRWRKNLSWVYYVGVFEGGNIFIPGIVIEWSREGLMGLDLRIFGHAWIYNRGCGWKKRLPPRGHYREIGYLEE